MVYVWLFVCVVGVCLCFCAPGLFCLLFVGLCMLLRVVAGRVCLFLFQGVLFVLCVRVRFVVVACVVCLFFLTCLCVL